MVNLFQLTLSQVVIRLVVVVIASGLIGYDREQKNRPAGIKTHILVGIGACIIALIQKEIGYDALNVAMQHPSLTGVLRADDARLTAQVVSGIGFLGAGTIMVQHRTIRGLTTAASLWAVACIGLGVGLGDYRIAIAGTVTILLVLLFSQRLIRVSTMKRIEIKYRHKLATKEFIQSYFDRQHIKLNDVNFKLTQTPSGRVYTNIYEIALPRHLSYSEVIEDLSLNQNVLQVQTVSI